MKCSKEPPPIYEKAKEMFGVSMEEGVVFTYGETCHVASGAIPDWLTPHEETHMRQQGDKPAAWWEQYFIDPKFRFEQELEAYREQYQWILRRFPSPQQKHKWLTKFATDLSGPMYGDLLTFYQAYDAIRKTAVV